MQQLTTQQNDKASLKTAPLFIKLRDDMAKRIAAGEWKAEQQIPNEVVLAAEYGISQGTMRKALDELEAMGVLTRKQGRGTFVNNKGARMRACVGKSLHIIKEAVDEASAKNVSSKLQTSLQTHIAEALFNAGYSGEGP